MDQPCKALGQQDSFLSPVIGEYDDDDDALNACNYYNRGLFVLKNFPVPLFNAGNANPVNRGHF